MTNANLVMIVTVTGMLTAPALAEPAPDGARCAKGIELARGKDLARAALYLEGCTGDAAERATATVSKQLRASALSALSIVSDASSVVVTFETDAMPGEKLATPTTIWAKAGTYKITVTSSVLETETTLAARSRATVVLRVAAPKAAPPRDGAVTFLDEPTDPQIAAPPPAQNHPSLLPCKYDGCDTHGGETLVDPLAYEAERLPPYPPELRVGVRVGAVQSDHVSATFAIAAHWKLLALRVDGSRRGYDHERYDDLGVTAGIAHVIASPQAAWVSLGVGLRGDLRANAMAGTMAVTSRAGAGANAELELALRSLPITLAARYEQGFACEHALVVELGGDWRVFN
ncbi:hypothetical protein BH11MYX1_BH11MYX1_33300 [soil metagenome]